MPYSNLTSKVTVHIGPECKFVNFHWHKIIHVTYFHGHFVTSLITLTSSSHLVVIVEGVKALYKLGQATILTIVVVCECIKRPQN